MTEGARHFDFPVEIHHPVAEPCYYSDPPRMVDQFCTDGGMASYAWTYTSTLSVDLSPGEVTYVRVPVEKAKPDYYLCKHHAASWRKQVEDLHGRTVDGASADYSLRSL